MLILRFDSVGGASGDMILGSLVGLGADLEVIRRALDQLPLGGLHLHVDPCSSHGLQGFRTTVHTHEAGGHGHEHPHEHAPAHAGEHGHHAHHEPHAHGGEHAHAHRGFTEIQAIIAAADLPEAVKTRAIGVFRRLGEAEAAIHGVPLEAIHFHEVGAADSIADIVGACLGLHLLGVEAVAVGPLPLGHGVIRCAHGVYPSPAPATLRLLQGLPVEDIDEPFETVTPTGAALLAAWRTHARLPDGARPLRSAHSFGHRALKGRPNLLRATLYEAAVSTEGRDVCLVLECNLDDTTPELIGALCERLMAAGALDVFTTAIQMKKQRPAVKLSVLCRPEARDEQLDLIFRGSTTFGVREYETARTTLARRWETAETAYGPIRIKVGTWRGEDVTAAPEMDDCLRAAAERGAPVRAVYEAALAAARRGRP